MVLGEESDRLGSDRLIGEERRMGEHVNSSQAASWRPFFSKGKVWKDALDRFSRGTRSEERLWQGVVTKMNTRTLVLLSQWRIRIPAD
jgi:hypothetical protein